MGSNPTYGKVIARIIFIFIPIVFCSVVCISTAFTHSLDGWLFPCGIFMVFMSIIELIGEILLAVAAYINS